jgi:hypothetical protein
MDASARNMSLGVARDAHRMAVLLGVTALETPGAEEDAPPLGGAMGGAKAA